MTEENAKRDDLRRTIGRAISILSAAELHETTRIVDARDELIAAQALLAALPSSGGGEKGDGSSRDHDHTAGIALEGSWPVAEYVEELANVLWQMARGDFSRSWSTNFRNEIRSAPNIITIAGNQLAKLAAVARSSAKQVVGESSRDEHSILPLSSSRGEAEQK